MEELVILYATSSILVAVIILLCLGYAGRNRRNHYLSNPLILASFFFALIHIGVPVMQFTSGFYRYTEAYSIENHIVTLFYAFLIYMVYFAVLAYLGAGSPYTFLSDVVLPHRTLKRLFGWSILVALVGGWAATRNFYRILTVGVQAYLADRISLSTGSGLQVLLAHWLYVAALMFYFIFLKSKHASFIRVLSGTSCIISIIAALAYYTVNSNRNSIFLLAMNLIVLHFLASKHVWKIPALTKIMRGAAVAALAVSCVALFYSIGKFRYEETGLSRGDYQLVQLINGAFGNHENIQWLLENSYRRELGQTYVAAITNFVPRRIWADKPLGGGPRLKNMIWPGSYVVGQLGISSLTTGMVTELAMNFGFIASIPATILIAIAIAFLFKTLRGSRNPVVGLWYIITVVTFSVQLFYAEFLGLLARYVVSVAPFAIIWFIGQLSTVGKPIYNQDETVPQWRC